MRIAEVFLLAAEGTLLHLLCILRTTLKSRASASRLSDPNSVFLIGELHVLSNAVVTETNVHTAATGMHLG